MTSGSKLQSHGDRHEPMSMATRVRTGISGISPHFSLRKCGDILEVANPRPDRKPVLIRSGTDVLGGLGKIYATKCGLHTVLINLKLFQPIHSPHPNNETRRRIDKDVLAIYTKGQAPKLNDCLLLTVRDTPYYLDSISDELKSA